MRDYLTLPEVADMLKVHPLTVRRWVAEDGLPVVRISRQTVRVSRSALEAWMDKRTALSVAN
jgi:excisionase family DNA binding protein